ncbi:MAG TPA: CHASE2 domain-containing protein, partial [Allocoleopsis sp.]
YRNLPVLPGEDELQKVFNSTPNLIGVEKVVGKQVNPSPTLAKLKQVGMADLVLDGDGKIRRGLLSVKTEKGETKLGLATRTSLIYLEKEGIKPGQNKQKQLTLGHAVFVPFTGNDGPYVNTNSGGFQILLNYRGTLENFKTISIIDVLEDRIPPGLMSDRIVFVGATGQSLNDLFLTPYSSRLFGSPKRIPGVIIHANIASQIINGAMNNRPFLKVWNDQVEWGWIFICSLIGAGGSWKLFNAKIFKKIFKKRNIFAGFVQLIAILLTGGSLVIGSYVIFVIGWWIPVFSPLLAFNISAIAIAIYQGRELQRLSEKKLAQFLEAVPIGIIVLDGEGKPYYSNHKAIELLGKKINTENTDA